MNQSTLVLIVLSLFLGIGAWLVFLWAARRGEFDDVEGPKHRMLEDDDDAVAPLWREGGASSPLRRREEGERATGRKAEGKQ